MSDSDHDLEQAMRDEQLACYTFNVGEIDLGVRVRTNGEDAEIAARVARAAIDTAVAERDEAWTKIGVDQWNLALHAGAAEERKRYALLVAAAERAVDLLADCGTPKSRHGLMAGLAKLRGDDETASEFAGLASLEEEP